MPLHDVGYRAWRGSLRGHGGAAAVIAATGIRLAWKSPWLRRVALFACTPALLFGLAFFAFEQAVDEARGPARQAAARRSIEGFDPLRVVVGVSASRLADMDTAEIAATRRVVWSRLLLAFMRAPQAVLLAVVVGLVAPPLISRDMRARAWLVHFTRPVAAWEYVLGKAVVMSVVVAAITLVPALGLWFVGVLVSPSVSVAIATWDLPLRIVAATVVLAVPTVLLALAYSSLTAETRIATFAWFATWVACWIAHSALVGADVAAAAAAPDVRVAAAPADIAQRHASGPARRMRWLARAAGLDSEIDRWSWLSLYHALGVAQAWVFGIERRPGAVVPPMAALAAVSVLSAIVVVTRVTAPLRT